MEKLNIRVTDDVSCGAELPMREGFSWAEISSGARVVGKDDLGRGVQSETVVEGVDLVLPGRARGSEPCCSRANISNLFAKNRTHEVRTRTRRRNQRVRTPQATKPIDHHELWCRYV
jgi:hypothetical protein